jgi:hypothetical protein
MDLFQRFWRKPSVDRRLLLSAAVLHAFVALALRVLPFRFVRRVLDGAAMLGPAPRATADVEGRVVRAVRTTAMFVPGCNCLTEALAALFLLKRYGCDATLAFGISAHKPADRPFDAHAWLEHGHRRVIGARDVAYARLSHPRTVS